MFTVALFRIIKQQKQLKCPLIDKQINKMYYIHTWGYYLDIKWNKLLTHDSTGVNPENTLKEF